MKSEKSRFQVLVTHNEIHPSAVEFLRENLCDVHFSPPYTSSQELAKKAKQLEIDAIMVRQGQINAEVIGASNKLKVIVKHGVGVDNIDLAAAQHFKIPVLRSIGSNALAVAEHTIALTLCLIKRILPLDKSIKTGRWLKPGFIGSDYKDKTIGLVGLGSIATLVAEQAKALGMNVLAYDPHTEKPQHKEIVFVDDLKTLLINADIVSLHCPLTPDTKHLINTETLALMKETAYLINTARGGLINENALLASLTSNQIAGAALDSFESEPPSVDNPLWNAPNLIVTPHIAGVTENSAIQMANLAAKHIVSILNGNEPDIKSICLA